MVVPVVIAHYCRLSLSYCAYCYIAAHIYSIAWLDDSKSRTVANLYIANLLIISQSAFSHFGLTICKSSVTILFVTLANLLRYERFHISYLPYVVSKSRT